MSYEMTDAVFDMELPAPEKTVLLALAHCHNGTTGRCHPGINRLKLLTGLSERVIYHIKKRLRHMRLIEYESTGGRLSNRYKLNIQPCTTCRVNPAPATVNPAPGAEEHRRTRNSHTEEKKKPVTKKSKPATKRKSPKPNLETETMVDVATLPEWIDLEIWNDFRTHRREQKCAMTETGDKYLLRKLEKLKQEGHDPNELMADAIANTWKSVWPSNHQRKPNGSRMNERIRRDLAEVSSFAGTDHTRGYVLPFRNPEKA